MPLKEIAEISAHFATVVVAVGAGFWFVISRRYMKRVEFDLESKVFRQLTESGFKIVELKFILDNKGQVEHNCYALAFEAVEMRFNGTSVNQESDGFIFRSGNIIDPRAGHYCVRPGVRQFIVHTISGPEGIDLLKVRAFFTYGQK